MSDEMLCECGSPLASAGPLGVYCTNKECPVEKRLLWRVMQAMQEHEGAYEPPTQEKLQDLYDHEILANAFIRCCLRAMGRDDTVGVTNLADLERDITLTLRSRDETRKEDAAGIEALVEECNELRSQLGAAGELLDNMHSAFRLVTRNIADGILSRRIVAMLAWRKRQAAQDLRRRLKLNNDPDSPITDCARAHENEAHNAYELASRILRGIER